MKNKCIDSYLSDIPNRYGAAVRAGFPALPKTIVNIHIELAPNYFNELDALRYKGSYSPTEIEGHYLHAEAMALATVCEQLDLDYEETEGILSDRAYDLAQSFYNESLTPEQNFSRIIGGKELKGKSVMYQNWVLNAFRFIAQAE